MIAFIIPPLMLKENWTPIDVFAEAFKNEWALTNKPAFFILIASIVALATLYKRANSKKNQSGIKKNSGMPAEMAYCSIDYCDFHHRMD